MVEVTEEEEEGRTAAPQFSMQGLTSAVEKEDEALTI